MGSLGILALLGIGALAFLMGGNDDPDDTAQEPTDPLPPEPTGDTQGSELADFFANAATTDPVFYDLMSGNDDVSAGRGDDTITSTTGDDTINAGAGDDLVFGGEGDDFITGQEGDDTLVAGAGDDRVSDIFGANELFGGDGADTIFHSDESTVTGGAGADVFNIFSETGSPAAGLITDFLPGEDRIGTITVDVTSDGVETPVSIEERADGTGIDVIIDGAVMTTVLGATLADFDNVQFDYVTEANPTQGIEIIPNGDSTLTGTSGNDTLDVASSDPDAFSITEVNLGDGADVAVFNVPSGATINGGADNDTLQSGGFTNTLNGDEGHDQLDGGPADNLNGGLGDDTLSVDIGTIYDGSGTLDGGEGNDTFNVSTDIGFPRSDFPSAIIVAGNGADTLNLTLNMGYDDYAVGPGQETSDSGGATAINLIDFDRAEDSLVIQIDRQPGHEDRVMTSAEIVDTSYVFQGELIHDVNIVMNFAATATYGAHTATIRLGEDVDLQIEDITFIQN